MIKTQRLCADKGARVSFLTRYIKLKQYVPNMNHQSSVSLKEKKENKKKKEVYSFKYEGGKLAEMLLHASVQYVKETKEGDVEQLFKDEGEEEDERIKWADLKVMSK